MYQAQDESDEEIALEKADEAAGDICNALADFLALMERAHAASDYTLHRVTAMQRHTLCIALKAVLCPPGMTAQALANRQEDIRRACHG